MITLGDCWRISGDATEAANNGWTLLTSSAFGDGGRFKSSMVLTQSGGVYSLLLAGGYTEDGSMSRSIWQSKGFLGQAWTLVTANAPWNGRANSNLFVVGDSIFFGLGGVNGGPDQSSQPFVYDLWQSSDNGVTFAQVAPNIPWPAPDYAGQSVYTTDNGVVYVYQTALTGVLSLGVWRIPYSTGGWRQYPVSLWMSTGPAVATTMAGFLHLPTTGAYIRMCGVQTQFDPPTSDISVVSSTGKYTHGLDVSLFVVAKTLIRAICCLVLVPLSIQMVWIGLPSSPRTAQSARVLLS